MRPAKHQGEALEAQLAEAGRVDEYYAAHNRKLEEHVTQLGRLLADALAYDATREVQEVSRHIQHVTAQAPMYAPGGLEKATSPPPPMQQYLPAPLSGAQRYWPPAHAEYDRGVVAGKARHAQDLENHRIQEANRIQQLAIFRENYDRQLKKHQERLTRLERRRAPLAALRASIAEAATQGTREAILDAMTRVLANSRYPEGFPHQAKLAYVPESKQLVVEADLPPFSAVPDVTGYKYVKAQMAYVPTVRPVNQRKALYAGVIAQVGLRSLHELSKADPAGHVESIVFNGYVETIDPGTGRMIRPCLITVRATRQTFGELDLSRVDPLACLKVLNAGVSKSPSELAPVRPVLEFSMVDPRFIAGSNVLEGLDQRPNLMELTPSEFEALIANLFEKMGLETRQTQASRDGGVDCVAYDPRPILGGKVVIQAKRYKHTVGVSAVRDLFGTVNNEGASKGILVTTSGYGKAAFDFAKGKPLELLSGSHLLYLLEQHAGVQAKIEAPAEWHDPQADTAEE